MPKSTDSRRARSDATKDALMRAAEKLIAEQGVENTSIREIVAAAGAKNESALQYHFGSLGGLLTAIHQQRSEQIRSKRAELLAATLAMNKTPTLRQLCALMIEPTFRLAQAQPDFRRYIKAFGAQPALLEQSPLKTVMEEGGGGISGAELAKLLRAALPDLDETDFLRRMEAAVLMCSGSMHHHARRRGAFRGDPSELFLQALIDGLSGLLGAPISAQTRALKAPVTSAKRTG